MLVEKSFIQICVECFLNHCWWGWVYSGLVFILCILLIKYDDSNSQAKNIPRGMLPNPSADLPSLLRTVIKSWHHCQSASLNKLFVFFKPETLRSIATIFIIVLERFYSIRGDYCDYARSFKTALCFYFIIIPLPAAFLPPVNGAQIDPGVQLMIATLLLIVVNAVGDTISVNFSSRIIRRALNLSRAKNHEKSTVSADSQVSVKDEINLYTFLLLDLVCATGCLILVLMVSSVLYGVQVGEYTLNYEPATLSLMLESAKDFCRLFGALYWFEEDPDAVLGQPGIPGMILFSLTTFLPTLFIGLSALAWFIVFPIRILFLSKKINLFIKFFASEFFVFVLCLGYVLIISIDIRAVYALIITICAT